MKMRKNEQERLTFANEHRELSVEELDEGIPCLIQLPLELALVLSALFSAHGPKEDGGLDLLLRRLHQQQWFARLVLLGGRLDNDTKKAFGCRCMTSTLRYFKQERRWCGAHGGELKLRQSDY